MTTCAQCGASLSSTANFCTSCGAAPSAPAGQGPVGRTRGPGMVILLTLVTFGIYSLFYWWSVTKETDAFTSRPGHAHGKFRLGIFLSLGAGLLMFVASFAMLGTVFASVDETGTPDEGALFAGIGVSLLMMLVGVPIVIVSMVLLIMAYWRVWSAIRDDEQRRAVPSPLSPGLMLVFFLLPYVNFITMWIALYRTQKGLNGMWEAAKPHVVGGIQAA